MRRRPLAACYNLAQSVRLVPQLAPHIFAVGSVGASKNRKNTFVVIQPKATQNN